MQTQKDPQKKGLNLKALNHILKAPMLGSEAMLARQRTEAPRSDL